MFKNYLKIAFRNLIKNKSHTLINIGGLSLGVICALVIFLVIQFELSYDKFHEEADRIYRVVHNDREYGEDEFGRGGPYPLAEAVENEVNGIEYVTIINNNFSTSPVVSLEEGNRKFQIEDFAFVEPDYFNIFSYQWLSGDKTTAISNPNTVVLIESLARKLFGNTDVIGKSIVFDIGSKADLRITGVVKDLPETSDFKFELFGSTTTRDRNGETAETDNWNNFSSSIQTFVRLSENADPDEINPQFKPIVTKYRGEERAKTLDFFLQPLSEIHYDSRFGNFEGRTVEKRTLFALGLIGLFLLITACINFINLNTAIAVSRSKEVGLRKTLGGTRFQLIIHFLGETALVTLIAIILGIGITEFITPWLNPILGFTPELNLLSNLGVVLFLVGLFLIVTLAAGWYPAQYLSGFNPIEAIRNKINSSYGRGLTLRRSLIVVQFGITQILIICTIIIASQIEYFQSEDLGYKKDAIVEISVPNPPRSTLNAFKNELLVESSIQNVTFSNTGATSNSTWSGNYIIFNDTTRIENNAHIKFIDENYVDTYGLTLLAGENITPSDTVNKFLVNESFAKQAGFGDNYQDIIGVSNSFWGNDAPIVGVVKDFNTQSLKNEISPVLLAPRRTYYTGAIKINTSNTSQAITAIETAFEAIFPDLIFDYSFLDEKIEKMYEKEKNTARIMNAFTIIAIIIGCLGLYGLVSYMSYTKTKEIAVRKVLGASVQNILLLFGKELGILTGISFAFAAPLAWYLMQNWLADFPYRIQIGLEIFAMTLAATFLFVLVTVGFKSIKSAIANPVNSLSNE